MEAGAPAAPRGLWLLRRAADVRPAEAGAVLWAFLYFFALVSSFYLLRPIREEMGIRGGVDQLQWLFTGTFVVMLAAVPAYSALVARVPRARAVPIVYRFFAANLLLFFVLLRAGAFPVAVARTFFVWLSVYNLFVVSVFWSYMADLFTSEQGKRLFGFVAGGGSAGALAGSALAGGLVGLVGIANLLLGAVVLLEVAVLCARRLAAGGHGRAAAGASDGAERAGVGGTVLSGVAVVFRSPYLLAISGLMLLYTLASTFLYFQQARIVAGAISDPARRTALFAAVDFAVNVGAFAVQAFATGRIAAAFGLGPGLAAVPLVSAAGFAALAAAPSLAVVASFQTLRRTAEYALQRPARDVLFTVVSREEKYKSKGFIDTVVYRGGDALAGWAYAGLAAVGLSMTALALSAIPAALASLGVALFLTRRHRALEGTRP